MCESPRDLACAIGSEVEKNDCVAVVDFADGLSVFVDDDSWLHELIAALGCIACVDGFLGAGGSFARSGDVRRVCPIRTFPAIVAVHAVVASYHRADATDTDALDLSLQLLQVC